MLSIEEIKDFMKKNKITYQMLSDRSGIPLNSLKQIFRGRVQNPRIDTMTAILEALGINGNNATISPSVESLIGTLSSLSDEEVAKAKDYLDFIISQRK